MTSSHAATAIRGLVAALACLSPATTQTATAPTSEDPWSSAVEKANTHGRFAVRRAAANKIARAGAAAVPAVRAWTHAHGRETLDILLVDSIARSGSSDDAVVSLLADWADDRNFYWRAQALDGLANRATPAMRERFLAALDDPSHLYRVAGARGLTRLGALDVVAEHLDDPDPRARTRIARALLLAGDDRGLPELLDALGPRRQLEFLGDAWGQRDADLAVETIEEVAGEDFGWRGAGPIERTDAIARIHVWAARRRGRPLEGIPAASPPEPTGIVGGAEIRSCRNGDLFVRWTEDAVLVGLDDPARFPLGTEGLTPPNANALPDGLRGRVVCDFVRVLESRVEKHGKFAPGSLPPATANWLNRLARAVESAAGGTQVAEAIRSRLPQFEAADSRADSRPAK